MPDLDEPHLHQLTVDEIFKYLETREGGLSPEEAQQRLSRHGPNILEEPSHYSLIRGFLHQFTHFLAILLWIATALALITYTPLGNAIFGTSPLPAWIFGPLALGALVLLFAEETRKIIVNRFTNSRAGRVT